MALSRFIPEKHMDLEQECSIPPLTRLTQSRYCLEKDERCFAMEQVAPLPLCTPGRARRWAAHTAPGRSFRLSWTRFSQLSPSSHHVIGAEGGYIAPWIRYWKQDGREIRPSVVHTSRSLGHLLLGNKCNDI